MDCGWSRFIDRWWFLAALACETLFVFAVALYFLWHSYVDVDEGFYLAAANRVLQGALPYEDFPLFQGPLTPYVYAVSQKLAGQGILAGRATSAALFLITFFAGVRLAWLVGGRTGSLLFAPLFVLSPLGLVCLLQVRTYPISAVLLALTGLALLDNLPPTLRWLSATFLLFLALLVRVSMLPLFLGIATLSAMRLRGTRASWWFWGASVPVAFFVALAIARVGADRLYFNLVESQLRRDTQWATPTVLLNPPSLLSLRDKANSLNWTLQEFPVQFPLALLAAVLLVPALTTGWRLRGTLASPLAVLTLLAWGAYLPQLVTRVTFPHYFVPSLTLFAAVGAGALGAAVRDAPRERPFLGAALAAIMAVQGLHFYANYVLWTDARPPIERYQQVSAVVQRVTPEEKRILTLDLSVAVEARREVPETLSMGPWSFWRTMDHATAVDKGVVNGDSIWWLTLRRDVSTIVFTDFSLGILLGSPSIGCRPDEPLSEEELRWAIPELTPYALVETGQIGARNPVYVLTKRDGPSPIPQPKPVGWTRPTCEDLVKRSPAKRYANEP